MEQCVRVRVVRLAVLGALLSTGSAASGFAQALPAPWSSADVGSPAIAGSASDAAGTFTITAAGAGIGGTADQFQFVYQNLSGDVDVRVRVDAVSAAATGSAAGVMLRSGLGSGSVEASVLVTAGQGVAFRRRVRSGRTTYSIAGPNLAPAQWVRLVRHGSLVTALWYDGGSWNAIGAAMIPLSSSVYVGIAASSANVSALTTASVSNVAFAALAWPIDQSHADIGSPTTSGGATFADGVSSLDGAGAGITGTTDQFHYIYQPLTGDATVTARVAWLSRPLTAATGIMIRETLTGDSRHAFAAVSAGNGYAFDYRLDPGASTSTMAGGSGTAPGWLRLVRAGDVFTAFRSADGVTWTTMGAATINMGSTVYVGIPLTSSSASSRATAVVDRFSVVPTVAVANLPPTVSLTSPASGASYVEPATIGLSASASDPEGRMGSVAFYAGGVLIGTVTAAPYALSWTSVPAGSYTVTAVATDLDGASTTSAPVSVTVSALLSPPHYVVFSESTSDPTVVSYRFDVFAGGADPSVAAPIASVDLGHPVAASDGTITVDELAFFTALPAGSYVATVAAVGTAGESQSAAATFAR